ncbi:MULTISPECIES: acyl-CoA synthetase [unclassified Bradyrhizobium]|uniref:acyl-CoA synthetase n=1 Tax=unclassified Bradyrhizobium TaxID=2631580 RepID=UPI001CD66C0A|nr:MULTISPECIES: acyl-CoA synthetase [unclassified Bradyrhizobium]MCA1386142.1 AMP-binding protein [Bradyrhizobium sp. BRP05]MCA1394223.1 AMP-binding protein [Bradyrhizobium sp. IC3123]MCA1423682.1 AMP-binding protein [Bradyrhizobium sp. BRP23]MCA1430694.1 AMP-binding protein [Bradyrhizobium sp. NBAIM16]MCA1480283.1 AMP-binding protein [Bradyrhizobium sp. NBAIM08]
MIGTSPLFHGIISGERRRSHSDVADRAMRIAGGLARLGIREGDSVCILMRNEIAFVEVTHGVMQLGAYAVPVNWHFKRQEIEYIVADSGAQVLIGHADLLHQLERDASNKLVLSIATPPELIAAYNIHPALLAMPGFARDFERWIADQPSCAALPAAQPTTMIYTSGTTGHPKGVRRVPPTGEQAAGLEDIRAILYGPGARALVPGPLYHSAPNFFGIWFSRRGGALVLMPRFEPEELLRLIEAEKIDTILMVPTMFVRLMQLPESVRMKYDLSSLRHVVHGAAPCPSEVKRGMIEWWGPIIHEFYGSTEAGAVTFATSLDWLQKPGTVGTPLRHVELRVVGVHGQVLPAGEVGEIYSCNTSFPRFTYHNRPEKLVEMDQEGFIASGDLGFVDAHGYLFLCDRLHNVVISGGVNIYPAEIEAALHMVQGVHDCAVFGIPDAEFGEALMAVVEPQPGTMLNVLDIREKLKTVLADYKVPREIEIRTRLPREDSGKIFKRQLRDPYWEQSGRRI